MEVEQHGTHLVHVPAKMLAREGMSHFVNDDDDHSRAVEEGNLGDGVAARVVQRRHRRPELRPLGDHHREVRDEEPGT